MLFANAFILFPIILLFLFFHRKNEIIELKSKIKVYEDKGIINLIEAEKKDLAQKQELLNTLYSKLPVQAIPDDNSLAYGEKCYFFCML